MDRSRQLLFAIEELKQIRSDIRSENSLDAVRRSFERLQEIRRLYVDDFDLQILIANAQQEVVERARVLRGETTGGATTSNERRKAAASRVPEPEPNPDEAQIPPEVPKLDKNSWKVSLGLAILFTVGICAAFFYLIQTARKINFPAEPTHNATEAPVEKKSDTAAPVPTTATVSTAPSPGVAQLRLFTDLTGGTMTLDDQPPRDLTDGQLQFDAPSSGEHTIKVEGKSGTATFRFALANDKDVPRVIEKPRATNALAVLISVKDGQGRLTTDAEGASVSLDQKPVGAVGPEGLLLSDLGDKDHDLVVAQPGDRQKFVLTYTPSPTLTVFIKSDPSIGTLTVTSNQDGATVFINDSPYKRLTENGELRIPLKVGSYRIRIHKAGFTDPPASSVDIKKNTEASTQFRLQAAAPEYASLQISGAAPATTVYVDRVFAANVGADGTAKIVNVYPGDHSIELRHDQAITKQLSRSFVAGQTVFLQGSDTALDRLAADNKSVIPGNPGGTVIPPPEVPHLEQDSVASSEQVHKGGGFVPYHTVRAPGSYFFQAHTKLGGLLHHNKLQWYAGYQNSSNYVLFTIDGKHAEVREVRDGRSVDLGRVSFPVGSDEWVQIEVSVKANSLQARAKTSSGAWTDLSPVTTDSRDFTQDGLGLYIPSNDEVAVANFRFSNR